MGNPTDRPDFNKIAMSLMYNKYDTYGDTNISDPSVIAFALRDIYEQGYHVGLIYGWGMEQEQDRLAEEIMEVDKEVLKRLANAQDELRELDIVGELSDIIKHTAALKTAADEERKHGDEDI